MSQTENAESKTDFRTWRYKLVNSIWKPCSVRYWVFLTQSWCFLFFEAKLWLIQMLKNHLKCNVPKIKLMFTVYSQTFPSQQMANLPFQLLRPKIMALLLTWTFSHIPYVQLTSLSWWLTSQMHPQPGHFYDTTTHPDLINGPLTGLFFHTCPNRLYSLHSIPNDNLKT